MDYQLSAVGLVLALRHRGESLRGLAANQPSQRAAIAAHASLLAQRRGNNLYRIVSCEDGTGVTEPEHEQAFRALDGEGSRLERGVNLRPTVGAGGVEVHLPSQGANCEPHESGKCADTI